MPVLKRSAGRYGRSWNLSVTSAISWYVAPMLRTYRDALFPESVDDVLTGISAR